MENKVEIITEGFPEHGKEQILLDEITCKYYQEADCTEDRDGDGQEIILSTRDGGGGKFIHIKTEGWSISDENDLVVLIRSIRKLYEEL